MRIILNYQLKGILRENTHQMTGKQIKERKEELNLTSVQLAEEFNNFCKMPVTYPDMISKYERGVKNPSKAMQVLFRMFFENYGNK